MDVLRVCYNDVRIKGAISKSSLLPFALLLISYVFFVENTTQLLPLVALCAGDCGGPGAGGGGVGGGTADNSGIGDPGGPTCGNDSCSADVSGNVSGVSGPSESSSSSGPGGNCGPDGSSCSGGVSTPFLYVWRNGRYELENDVMFGKPINVFRTEAEGKIQYEQGNISSDLYKIQTPPQNESGTLRLQIREIEPEESFIDHLSLSRVSYPKDTELFVDSTLRQLVTLRKKNLYEDTGVTDVRIESEREIPVILSELKAKLESDAFARSYVHVMETGESITVKGKVLRQNKPIFLILGSNYRDWAIPMDLVRDGPTVRNFFKLVRNIRRERMTLWRTAAYVAALTLVFIPAWFLGSPIAIPGQPKDSSSSDASLLSQTFGISIAQADAPPQPQRSFRIEYWDGQQYQFIDMVHPRYYKANFDAVRIPASAISKAGEVNLRITATKRHNLTHVSFCVQDDVPAYRVARCELVKAVSQRTGRDYATTLTRERSGGYAHTLPSDVIDFEFRTLSSDEVLDSERAVYLLTVGGYYTPLSEKGEKTIGDWMSKLKPDSRVWLEEMASFKAV